MTYHARIIELPTVPESVKKAVQSLHEVREAIMRLEMVLEHGPSEGALTREEVKRLDKAVTVVKVGLKIAKKSLSHRDPKKHLIAELA